MGTISHIPLLHHQRAIYHLPRGRDRFTHYLGLIRDGSGDLALPLPAFNPMGRDQVAATLDMLIALGAEALAAEALASVVGRLGPIAGDYRLGLVVVDDLGGGWTSRPLSEFDHKFRNQALRKRGWLVAPIWTSEPVSSDSVRLEVAATAWRGATLSVEGEPRTLRAILDREARLAEFLDASPPEPPDGDELGYTLEVLAPYLEAEDLPTQVAALHGDDAARGLGFEPLGLEARAGYRLAWSRRGRELLVSGCSGG